jgi:hypothetical protein
VRRGGVEALKAGGRMRSDSPFVDLPRWREAIWIEPRLVAEIRHLVEEDLREAALRRAQFGHSQRAKVVALSR